MSNPLFKQPIITIALLSTTLTIFILWLSSPLFLATEVNKALAANDSELIIKLNKHKIELEQLIVKTTELQTENKTLQQTLYSLAEAVKSQGNLNIVDTGTVVIDQNKIPSLSKPDGCEANRGLINQQIRFANRFSTPPTVMTSFQFLDFGKGVDHRLKTQVTNVTTMGFTLSFNTWCDTKMSHSELQWLAIGS